MSVEKAKRRALRRVMFWRLCLSPFLVLRLFARFLFDTADFFEDTFFMAEINAAIEYRNLTGVDLGVGSANPGRYAHTTPEAWERVRGQLEP